MDNIKIEIDRAIEILNRVKQAVGNAKPRVSEPQRFNPDPTKEMAELRKRIGIDEAGYKARIKNLERELQDAKSKLVDANRKLEDHERIDKPILDRLESEAENTMEKQIRESKSIERNRNSMEAKIRELLLKVSKLEDDNSTLQHNTDILINDNKRHKKNIESLEARNKSLLDENSKLNLQLRKANTDLAKINQSAE